ncbi:MAG: gluconate 2-dehydrogenase subunit 3 family protein [Verrucomicrobia bacterium]|nr:gluconate 2-dehydrogenase subunit 3 family protein [Verrucomicrobiota bacterium]
MDRRRALEWLVRVSALVSIGTTEGFGQGRAAVPAAAAAPAAAGYGPDPSMVKVYNAGDVWPLTLDASQRRTVKALCDVIVPADAESPSASAVGVVEFLDEWVSAPYPEQREDRPLLLDGLGWVNAQARMQFGKEFADLDGEQKQRVCETFADPALAKAVHGQAARFFRRFRNLTVGGYYTTSEGMKAAGYAGNVPVAVFEGPTPEALRHLGLA